MDKYTERYKLGDNNFSSSSIQFDGAFILTGILFLVFMVTCA